MMDATKLCNKETYYFILACFTLLLNGMIMSQSHQSFGKTCPFVQTGNKDIYSQEINRNNIINHDKGSLLYNSDHNKILDD